ncbi:Oidioi.mRNA.OKI2018_I69.XSR.g16239.t1.cds [Oikopleura dioica]|uniref:Oidioi.mRNA.OKI2018_I69.XSR.g16239.t1.cds n=1 Tax=Oikopleura dioica TaxID=34765 RepID=A0ABN7SFF1_OIKDI|nr:Oidioi.mRNA.OKI2018_I69.XSR.g16239.t1.cds [Oikopleura dioica]
MLHAIRFIRLPDSMGINIPQGPSSIFPQPIQHGTRTRHLSTRADYRLISGKRITFLMCVVGICSTLLLWVTSNSTVLLDSTISQRNAIARDRGLRIFTCILSTITAVIVRYHVHRQMATFSPYILFLLSTSTILSLGSFFNYVLLVNWSKSRDFQRITLFGTAFLFLFNSLSAFVYVRFGRIVAIIDHPVPAANTAPIDDPPPKYEEVTKISSF